MAYIVPDKLPENCYLCPFCEAQLIGDACGINLHLGTDSTIRPDWCPLIEIPTGARLVDTSKLVNYRVTGNATVGSEDFGKQTYTMLPVASLSELPAVYEE